MRAIRYEEPGAGFARLPGAALLTTLLGGGAMMGGRLGGDALGGLPGILEPIAAFARSSMPATGDAVSWGWAGVIGAGVALLYALSADPRRRVLAALSVAAFAFFGLMLLRAGEVELPDEFALPEVPALQEVAELAPDLPGIPEIVCPSGTFPNGEGCMPCMVSEPERQALILNPVPIRSAWRYASEGALTGPSGEGGGSLAEFSPSEACASDAVLALGSASSDGPPARNRDRAERRARALMQRVRSVCGADTQLFAATLGQSGAPADTAADRAVTLLTIDAAEGEVARAAVERELGYLLAERAHESPLLSRLRHFDGTWSWVEGEEGAFTPYPQARRVTERLRADAPASCERPV